ncbi:hypothetical protein WMW72_23280 [Paenibacillus filicis]|uniref:NmrA-like domain-containing protein n=1 Tax=Paenibacillus filicis TaxID=669464 RepID=A0ABU9DRX6_9BACL
MAEALNGAQVVVDVSNSPSFEDKDVLEFFESSTQNLLAAEAAAGVGHHVALSVVGTEGLLQSGYRMGLDQFVGSFLSAQKDNRQVVVDDKALYFRAELNKHSLVPTSSDAYITSTHFNDWLSQSQG